MESNLTWLLIGDERTGRPAFWGQRHESMSCPLLGTPLFTAVLALSHRQFSTDQHRLSRGAFRLAGYVPERSRILHLLMDPGPLRQLFQPF
jgi:hypothetical protein